MSSHKSIGKIEKMSDEEKLNYAIYHIGVINDEMGDVRDDVNQMKRTFNEVVGEIKSLSKTVNQNCASIAVMGNDLTWIKKSQENLPKTISIVTGTVATIVSLIVTLVGFLVEHN